MKRIFAVAVPMILIAGWYAHATDVQATDVQATDRQSTAEGAALQAGLTDAERGRLVEMLETSRAETEALIAKATGERWKAKPAEDRWSVAEVVEHLAIAEEGLFGLASGALASDADPEWETSAAEGIDGLVTMIQDRTQKFQAPEGMQPQGDMGRDELIGRYAAARAKTLSFVKETEAPVKKHTASGPPGKMNVHQWLALIGAHNLRHNKQIEEVLDTLGEEASL